jgi:pseudouridine-5'-monophosphatase
MSKYGPYTHVIFDMDGLLLNTEHIYTQAYQRVAQQHGTNFTWEIKVQLMGMPGKPGAQKAVDLMNIPLTADEFIQALHRHKQELFPTAQLLPGAEKLVRHLHKHGVPIAVASGSFTHDFNTKTTHHKEFFQLFPIVVLGDDPDLKHGKPEPDQFLLTLGKFPAPCPPVERVLVFEDSPNGVLAAKAAGMGVVLVPDERLEKGMYHDPTATLKSLEDFVPEEFGLPPYDM